VALGVLLDLIPGMPQLIPNICYGLFALTIIFFVPYRLYVLAKEEAQQSKDELDKLKTDLVKKSKKQADIDGLAEHRSEGISILNKRPSQHGGLVWWIQEWEGWRSNVITDLDKNFTRAESLSFQRLGVVTDPAPQGEDQEHSHKLQMLSKQLRILEELISKY